MQQVKKPGREYLSSLVILFCIVLTILTSIGVNYLDVKLLNIELIDRQLYSVITETGNINIHPDDVLRIERTYSKEGLTGDSIELDKIYTDKGFIFISSKDHFAEVGRKLMNSVDYYGLPLWERPNVEWESIKKHSYAIGTPAQQVTLVFFLLSLQYAALTIGAIALVVLVFPLRFGEEDLDNTAGFSQGDKDVLRGEEEGLEDEVIGTFAK